MNKPIPSLTKLRSFAAIAHCGSFQKAAAYLGVSQPALSAQLTSLEKELGVALLHRTTRHTSLTEHGDRLLTRVDRVLFELDLIASELEEEVQLQRGRVTVACVPTIAASVLPSILKGYSASYPQILVYLFDFVMNDVVEAVRRGDADFGIGPIDGDVEGCYCEPVGHDAILLCCPKGHPMAARESLKVKELEELPLIMLEKRTNTHDTLERAFAGKGLQFEPTFIVNHHLTLAMMVREGLGFGVLPSFAICIADQLELDFVPISHPKLQRTISILVRSGGRLSPAATKLAQYVRERLGSASKELDEKMAARKIAL